MFKFIVTLDTISSSNKTKSKNRQRQSKLNDKQEHEHGSNRSIAAKLGREIRGRRIGREAAKRKKGVDKATGHNAIEQRKKREKEQNAPETRP
jgi:hypothetical protein